MIEFVRWQTYVSRHKMSVGARGFAVRLNSQAHCQSSKVENMKKQTQMNLPISFGFALALALALSPVVQAQSPKPAERKMKMEGTMMESCGEIMKQKQTMKEDMKAQDANLTELLARMNRAPEGKKMNLMAAVITHMVEQRISMDARHAMMEEVKMKHMMGHMQMGGESMSKCPMMKVMKSTDEKSEDTHKEHQKK